ncbi:MAG TPA: hypothetical protein PK811_00105 [bacterium]|nr:hypothetical protein [bacterium]
MNDENDSDVEKPENEIEKRKFGYDEIKRVFDKQWEAIDVIDSKASTLLGFLGVIISLSFTLVLSEYSNSIFHNYIAFCGFIFILFGILCLFISLILDYCVIKIHQYSITPKPETLSDIIYEEKEPLQKLLDELLVTTVETYKENEKYIEKKEKFFKYTFYLLVLGLFLILFGVLLFIFSLSLKK